MDLEKNQAKKDSPPAISATPSVANSNIGTTPSTPSITTSKLYLEELEKEISKINEKSFSLLEQKIAHQEADIALLKDMIKARDFTIEKLQKELQELRSLRDREKSSAAVVTDLAGSIKSNVDSAFRSAQDPTGADFNKMVIEVKKQLAMSFLNDYKESKGMAASRLGLSLGPGMLNSPSVNMDSMQSPIQRDKNMHQNYTPNLPYTYGNFINSNTNNVGTSSLAGLKPISIPNPMIPKFHNWTPNLPPGMIYPFPNPHTQPQPPFYQPPNDNNLPNFQ